MATKNIPLAPKLPAETPAPAATEPAAEPISVRETKPVVTRRSVVARRPTKPMVPPVKANEAAPGKVGKKPVKPRPVLVRDSFTMPEADFALIAKLKSTALGARRAAKKSELLRAGLQILAGLDADALVGVLERLETVKTGRPKKGH